MGPLDRPLLKTSAHSQERVEWTAWPLHTGGPLEERPVLLAHGAEVSPPPAGAARRGSGGAAAESSRLCARVLQRRPCPHWSTFLLWALPPGCRGGGTHRRAPALSPGLPLYGSRTGTVQAVGTPLPPIWPHSSGPRPPGGQPNRLSSSRGAEVRVPGRPSPGQGPGRGRGGQLVAILPLRDPATSGKLRA